MDDPHYGTQLSLIKLTKRKRSTLTKHLTIFGKDGDPTTSLNCESHRYQTLSLELHPTTHKFDANAQQYIHVRKQAGGVALQQLDIQI